MTTRFFGYLLLLGLLYMTLNYTGYSFLMYFFFFLLLLPLLSLAAAIIARRTMEIWLELTQDHVERGETVKVYVKLRNRGFLPLPLVALAVSYRELSTVRDQPLVRLRLGAGTGESFAFVYHFPNRGEYLLKIVSGRLRDSCGFFTLPLSKRCLRDGARLEVWPRRMELTDRTATNISESDREMRQSSRVSQEPDDVARLRLYQPGDKLKLVHWSVSARMQELQVREFEEPRDLETAIVLADALPKTDEARMLADAGAEVSLGICAETVATYLPSRLILASPDENDTNQISATSVSGFNDLDFAASALARQLPESLFAKREQEQAEKQMAVFQSRGDLKGLFETQLSDATKVVYLITYILDDRLVATLRGVMKQLNKLYLIILSTDPGQNMADYREVLMPYNIQITTVDPRQFLLSESEGDSHA